MILRPTIQTYSSGGVLTSTIVNVGCILTVDDTVIVSTANLNGITFPSTPVVTTNGLSVLLDRENGVAAPNNLAIYISGLKVYQSTNVKFELTFASYESYTKTFKVFGYDLGNGVGAFGCNDFKLVMVQSSVASTTNYASLILYREPFTKRIRYYSGSNGTHTFYDSTSGTDIPIGTLDGFYVSQENTTLKMVNDLLLGVTTDSENCVEKVWFPTLEISSNLPANCTNTELYNINSNFSVLANLDFIEFAIFKVDGSLDVAYNDHSTRYRIYTHAGVLIAEKHFGFIIDDTTPVSFVSSVYEWTTAQIPEIGSYILEVTIGGWGVRTGILITSGSLIEGQWYRITNVSGGANFVLSGASASTIGIEFMANGTNPTWGSGELESIDRIWQLSERETIQGCIPYEVEQTDCNQYTVKNYSFNTITVVVSEMDTDGTFVAVTDGTYSIPAGGEQIIEHSTDNVYIYTITDLTAGSTHTKVITSYCNLRTCLLDYINDLICACVNNDACTDYCKKFYDFNALIISAHTYFNILNQEYNYNFIYTSLDPSKVAELYTAKQVLDRFADYCSSTSCNHSNTNCNCS